MFEKDINGHNHEEQVHDHDCDCGNGDCDCANGDSNLITLDMEDGTQKDFLVLDILEHEGQKYIALAEVDSNEYDILAMTVVGENVEMNIIEDDDEFNAVAAKFEELFSGTGDDDDDDEEDDDDDDDDDEEDEEEDK